MNTQTKAFRPLLPVLCLLSAIGMFVALPFILFCSQRSQAPATTKTADESQIAFHITELQSLNIASASNTALYLATITVNNGPSLLKKYGSSNLGVGTDRLVGFHFSFRSAVPDYLFIIGGFILLAIVIGIIIKRHITLTVRQKANIGAMKVKALESEALFRSTFDYAAVGIAHATKEGRFIRINRKFCDILGYSQEELLGRPFQELTHPDDIEQCENQLALLECGTVSSIGYEKRYIRKDGAIVWVQLNASPKFNPQGKVDYLIAFFQDITDRKVIEKALVQSESRLLRAQAIAHVGNWEVILPSMSLWASEEAFRIYGLPRDSEYMPLSIEQALVDASDRPMMDIALKQLISNGTPYDVEFHINRPNDKARRIIRSIATVEREPGGKTNKIIGVLQDITEKKQAEEAYSTAIQTTPDGFLLADMDGGILEANDSLCTILGYSKPELLSKNIADIEAFQDSRDVAFHMEQIRLKGSDRFETHYIGRNAELLEVEISSSYLPTNQCICIFLRDITDRKRNQEEIAYLVRARQEAFEASRAKSVFLSMMSHEIRTPLNSIIGLTHIARHTNTPELIEDYLCKIDASSQHLLSIINDILDISRIEAGKMTLHTEDFDFGNLMKEAVGIVTPRADEKKQTLNWVLDNNIAPRLHGDPMRLKQVLVNLISNAVKFTPANGTIIVSAKRAGDEGCPTVLLSVLDNGIGIPADKLESIFYPFEQLDKKTTREQGGTGLGLAISKRIVELMGGTIQVRSTQGKGSEFSFAIPLQAAVSNAEFKQINFEVHGAFSGKKILVVEDMEINQMIIREMLRETSAEILAAMDGAQALDMLRMEEGRIDAILMDIQMPGKDGYETTRVIRTSGIPSTDRVAIIAMTANAFKEDIEAALCAGMNDHISKPVDFKILYTKLCTYLQ